MLKVEGEDLALTPEAILHIVYCNCGCETKMSESVFDLLKTGMIEIKCPRCKTVLKIGKKGKEVKTNGRSYENGC